jgi:hypothetical protein
MPSYETIAPLYMTGSLLSFIGTGVLLMFLLRRTAAHEKSTALVLLVIISASDALYALKFFVSSLAYYCGGGMNSRHSFHIIDDNW